jgi:hypothetical protein
MREIDRGEPRQDLKHLGLIERGIHRFRHRQMRDLLSDMPTAHMSSTDELSVGISRGYLGAKVEVSEKTDEGKVYTVVNATYNEDVAYFDSRAGFMGVTATQQGIVDDEVRWELTYSSFGLPEGNSLSAGEVVGILSIASSESLKTE